MKKILLFALLGALLISGCVQEQPTTTSTTLAPTTTVAPAPTTTVAPSPTTTQPAAPTTTIAATAASLCPGQLTTKIKVKVGNLDSTDPFAQVAADYKVFNGETGLYTGVSGTSATSGTVDAEVPCGHYYKILYTGATIYPTSEEIFATGPSVVTTASARVLGAMSTVIYSTTGTESDNTIIVGTGQKYNQVRVKVSEITGNTAQDIVLLFNYDQTKFRSVKVVGKTMLPGLPTAFNTYKVAYETMDSLHNYQNAYYDVVIEAMGGYDPTGDTITVKAVDKSGYYKTVDTTNGIFQMPIPGQPTGMQDDNGADVGIQNAGEGEATLTVN